MIKITKDNTLIPNSLKIPNAEFFPMGNPPLVARTTHMRRVELIENGAYVNHANYNSRYKVNDIKKALRDIYKGKCGFCEQKIEQWHVEHYRPKDTYYWLAYSWNNLLVACATCNQFKGTNFDLDGTFQNFIDSPANRNGINVLSETYDPIELPRMVNPEVTNPNGNINFNKNGIISSNNRRFSYTIEKCKIDRKDLNDERRSLLDRFKEEVRSALLDHNNREDQLFEIAVLIKQFVRDSINDKITFLAFRRYAISSNWLNEEVKILLN